MTFTLRITRDDARERVRQQVRDRPGQHLKAYEDRRRYVIGIGIIVWLLTISFVFFQHAGNLFSDRTAMEKWVPFLVNAAYVFVPLGFVSFMILREMRRATPASMAKRDAREIEDEVMGEKILTFGPDYLHVTFSPGHEDQFSWYQLHPLEVAGDYVEIDDENGHVIWLPLQAFADEGEKQRFFDAYEQRRQAAQSLKVEG